MISRPWVMSWSLAVYAPERFRGITDPRGDLYGLGATLYELLALRPVFSCATSARTHAKILHEQLIPLRQINPLISRDLETVVHKAMARDVDDRYQSAAELSQELLRFHNDEPVKARRSSTAEKLLRIGRRNPVITSMVSVIAMLLVVISVISVFASVRLQQQLSQTRSAQRTGLLRLYDSLLMQARVTRRSDKEGHRFRALSLLQDASLVSQQLEMSTQSRQTLRDEAMATLCVADARNRPPFEAWPLGAVALDFDPSFERYARINSAGEITILRIVDQSLIEVIPAEHQGKPGTFSGRAVRFSHDGRWLLQLLLDEKNDQWLRVWNMTQTPAQMGWERSQVVTGSLGFTPDSRYVFVRLADVAGTDSLQQGTGGSLPTWFRLLSVESGTESLNTIGASVDAAIAFHPKLECFALSDNEKVSIVDFASRESLAQWRLPSVTHLLFNSDGETLFATTSIDGCVHCWDVTTQLERPRLRDEFPEPVETLFGNHRGDLLISTSKFALQAWEISSRRLLWQASSPFPNLRFSRDDKSLAGIHRADPKVSLLEVASDRELIRIATDLVRRGEDHSVDAKVVAVLHPSRKLFAATTAGGTILWDIDRAKQCGFLPGRRIPLGFDSNGTLLTYAPLPEGLRRWQTSPSAEQTGAFTDGAGEALYWVDEGQQLHQMGESARWSSSRDGNVLAMAAHSQGTFVYVADQSDMTSASGPVYRRLQVGPQFDVLWTSISPDGKWVATGSNRWAGSADDPVSVTVWDAHNGKRHKDLLTGHTGIPLFSPDGKCLSVLSGSYPGGVRWWEVDTWMSGPQPAAVEAPGGVTKAAFDMAHGWLAIQGEDVRVLDFATSRETFRLQTHEPSSLAPQFFTADGSHLVAVDLGSGEILIWNLALLEQEMQSLGLTN
ncbi:MAG: protein kinase family protein [Pirellulaceae bacterium]